MYTLGAALVLGIVCTHMEYVFAMFNVFTRSTWNNSFLFLNFIRTTRQLVLNFYFYYCNGVYNIWHARVYLRHCPFKTIIHFFSPSDFASAINKKKKKIVFERVALTRPYTYNNCCLR